ncbi:MAG: hypothetical protein IPK07_17400 [Deltaproteobacteria bacterium]|nr:hypothetical protein [Deltaproteobacteria bacterium]
MLSALTEGLSTVWIALDRALHPLYLLALLAFVASAVGAMWFSVAHRGPHGSRHPLARLEILWTTLTAMLVLGLATDSLRSTSHGPVQVAALLAQSYVDEPEPTDDAPADRPSDAADGGAEALGEVGEQPADAPADDGAQPSGDSGLPTDLDAAGADATVE